MSDTSEHRSEPLRYWFRSSASRGARGKENIALCEDAEPIVERLPDGRIFMCVADGLGGYPRGFDGRRGGIIASGTAVQAAFDFFSSSDRRNNHDPEALTNHIFKRLRSLAEQRLPPSRVCGTLGRHRLATTLAAVVFSDYIGDGDTTIHCYWIGDSRIYYFSGEGLQQLTKDDHVTNADAYEVTFESPPMSKFFAATMEREWCINRGEFVIDRPGVLIVCSDGCTSDWQCPWKFELALQKALEISNGWNQWVQKFKGILDGVRSDDGSFIAYPFNLKFRQFQYLREKKARSNAAIQALKAESETNMTNKEIWLNLYKPVYEAKLVNKEYAKGQAIAKQAGEGARENRARITRFAVSKKMLAASWLIGVLLGIPFGMKLSPLAESIQHWAKSLWPFT